MLEIRQETKNDEVPTQNFMAVKLNDLDVEIKGSVEYAKEFGI